LSTERKAVIFDIDGTIIYGDYLSNILMPYLGKNMDRFLKEKTTDAVEVIKDWTRLKGRVWKYGFDQGELKAEIIPELIPLLNFLKNKDYKIATFSKGSKEIQATLLGNTTSGILSSYFDDHFEQSDDLSKTEAKSYQYISDKLDIDIKNCTFITDCLLEYQAAQKAGMVVFLVNWQKK